MNDPNEELGLEVVWCVLVVDVVMIFVVCSDYRKWRRFESDG